MTDQTEIITLTQVWLGMTPYTLIELREASDGSGESALFVEAGGGVEEDPLAMPLLAITEQRPEDSRVAQMLLDMAMRDDIDWHTLEAVVREFNPDWLEFVTGGKP